MPLKEGGRCLPFEERVLALLDVFFSFSAQLDGRKRKGHRVDNVDHDQGEEDATLIIITDHWQQLENLAEKRMKIQHKTENRSE